MNILVLGGGDSTEHDVSVRSAAAVSKALKEVGFKVTEADPKAGFEVLDNLPVGTIVFPILHGQNGEDGVIQAELEKRGLPFLGTGGQASAICFDKLATRKVLEAADVPMAKGEKVTIDTYKDSRLTKIPHVLKVSRGGSSIGTYIVRDPSQIDQTKIDEVFDLNDEAVIEELVEGIEITVPVLDGKALPVIEIKPPVAQEFDYENKYNGASQEICPPASLDESQQTKAQELALKVDKVMNCRHLSRTDIIVRPDGSMAVLEVNTLPGMTDQSCFPLASKVSGMPMTDLVKKLVELVKRDYKLN